MILLKFVGYNYNIRTCCARECRLKNICISLYQQDSLAVPGIIENSIVRAEFVMQMISAYK